MIVKFKNSDGKICQKDDSSVSRSIDMESLRTNTAPRCPVVFLIDTSGSMGKRVNVDNIRPIDEVNKGIEVFIKTMKQDYNCLKRCDVAFITFGRETTVVSDFSSVEQKQPFTLETGGDTYTADALQLMLDMIKARKADYAKIGRELFRPLVFFLTDGGPTDKAETLKKKELIYQATKDKHLIFYATKIGYEKNPEREAQHMSILDGFDVKYKAEHLDPKNIIDYFRWVSRSVRVHSDNTNKDNDDLAQEPLWMRQLAE